MSLPRLLLLSFVVCVASLSAKDVQVKGYTRKDGTVVAPYVRSSPNSTTADNYSTKGNLNPNTGKPGTKSETSTASAATKPSSATGPVSTAAKSEAAKPQ